MDKELIYQNKKIHYRLVGKGKPVILIHGFGEEATVWNNQVGPPQAPPQEGFNSIPPFTDNFLSNKKFKFIIPDLPGTGQSEIIDDMSMEGMAETIHAIIHEENIEACPVIGHSMGGYILLALLESYWNHVSAFGLFHSTAFADSEEKKATRRKGIEFILQHGAFEFLKTTTPNLFSPQTKQENPGLIDQQVASLSGLSPATLIAYYEAMMQRPDRTDLLRKATVPVLFIMGEYDVAVPLEDGLKQCHLPGRASIFILQKSGHMGMLEEPGKTNFALEQFLTDV